MSRYTWFGGRDPFLAVPFLPNGHGKTPRDALLDHRQHLVKQIAVVDRVLAGKSPERAAESVARDILDKHPDGRGCRCHGVHTCEL